jgi:TolB-like protein/DNA-binding winged helix-turn-helix (wHTH) protein/Flp pilus assembly protein TadD
MTVDGSRARKVRFGPFAFDPVASELHKKGVKIKVQDQPLQILAALLERPGKVVTREELQERLWSADTFVDFHHSLATAVKKIRQALDDSADNPRFIETLRRRGYRFIGSVEAEPRAGRIMVAVLPFDNLSGDPDQEYFSDGVTEEIIAQLGRLNLQRLGIIARASVMRYKNTDKGIDQIGRELGVSYVLKGSVRRAGDLVRVAAELIQATDQTHIWAGSYERDWADVNAIYREVVDGITRTLGIGLLTEQPAGSKTSTANPGAHTAFLKGRYFWSKGSAEGLEKGIEYFEQATAEDPGYAVAYAGLAAAHNLADYFRVFPARQAFPRAKAAALKALELNAELAEAHNCLAFARHAFDWDWAAAEQAYTRGLEISPDFATARHWYGFSLGMLGRVDDALAEVRRAQELDPLSLIINTHLGLMLYWARRYDEAIEQLWQTLEMESNFAAAHSHLGWVYEQKAMPEESISHLQKAIILSDGSPEKIAALGHAYATFDRKGKARDILDQLHALSQRRFVSAYDFGIVYAGLGEKDQAFEWLERAYEERAFSLVMNLKADPGLDQLRSDVRYQDLLGRIGLPA